MRLPSSVCVYCGAATPPESAFLAAASQMGHALASHGIRLVYGGGRIGLMGLLEDAAVAAGGAVTGIIPRHLADKEVAHGGLSELVLVETMHERKRAMVDRSEAFVVLPGGLGTLDETFEILTWKQLGLHDRPIVIVNVAGYWDPMLQLIDRTIAAGFARPDALALFSVVTSIDAVIPALTADYGGSTQTSDLI